VEKFTMTRSGADGRSSHTRFTLVLFVGVLMACSLPGLAGAGSTDRGVALTSVPAPLPPPVASGPPNASASQLTESTLVLFNNTVVPGDFFSASSSLPSLEVFDARSDQVFVEGFYSGAIDVLSGLTNEVVATISTGEYPNTLAYDARENSLFYGLQTYDLVGYVNASTDLVERTVNIGFEPLAMAVDPVSGDLFVTGWNSTGTAFVAVISGSNGTVQSTFSFGANRFPVAGPNGLDYDPANGNFYVASIVAGAPGGTGGNLTVVNGSDPRVLSNIPLNFNPDSILYVPSTGVFYLGNASGNDLSVFSPSSVSVVASIALPNTPSLLDYGTTHKRVYVGLDGNVSVVNTASSKVVETFPVTRQPDGLAFDSRNGDLYISDYVSNNVSVVNSSSYGVVGSILLGASPYNMAYDSANGDLYIGDLESSQLIVLNGTTNRVVGFVPLGTTPYGLAYDPATQDVYVDDYEAGNVSVVSGATNSVVGFLPAGVDPWGIAYDGADHDLYVTNVGSNNITVLDPRSGDVAHTLDFTTPPGAIAYDAKSSTLFVGEYNTGNVSVLNATSNALIRNSTSGSEPYTISVDPVTGDAFVGNYASYNVTILGPRGQEKGLSVAAGVGVFGSAYDPVNGNVYVASFSSDLVTTISGSSNAGIGGYSVGSGPVAVAANPVTGAVYVANYDSGSLTLLTRAAPTYHVTFAETGLPHGKHWSVAFNGTLLATTGTSLTFTVPDGSYTYLVSGPAVYPVSGLAPEGTIVVNGASVAESVTFVRGTTYSLTFTEKGLPSGTAWCVDLGSTECTTTTSLEFHNLTNGTYAFQVVPVSGFTAKPGSGSRVIAGAAVPVTVRFT
jgi:YVTN family beta-propeller protein